MKVFQVLTKFCDQITLYNLPISMCDLLDLKIGDVASEEVNLVKKQHCSAT
jgi:hypothetical protein